MQELTSKVQWTDLMNMLVNELQDTGVTATQMAEALSTIPFVPAIDTEPGNEECIQACI
jgi:Putative Phosphatase